MWVAISSKGGVGKSLIAKNLLVPYVYQKYGKVLYVNTDDTNDEHKLVKAQNFPIEAIRITPKEIENLEPIPYAVLDTGAGRNAVEVLKALTSIDYQEIAKLVIVLSKRLFEINEAVKTFNMARKLGFKKIVLVLNRVSNFKNYREEFFALFSPVVKNEPLINTFEDVKENIVLFPYDDKEILGNTEDLERRLPYDAYLEADSFITAYREKLKEGKITFEDRTKRRFYGYLKEIFEKILSEKNLTVLEVVDNDQETS
jgi:MinD-like ATPase involved in chromosome partitioning or flagellar assembly